MYFSSTAAAAAMILFVTFTPPLCVPTTLLSISKRRDLSQLGSAPSIGSFSDTLTFLETELTSPMEMGSLTSLEDAFAILMLRAVMSLTFSRERRFVALKPIAPPTMILVAMPKLSSMTEGWGSPFFSMNPVPVPPWMRASAYCAPSLSASRTQ